MGLLFFGRSIKWVIWVLDRWRDALPHRLTRQPLSLANLFALAHDHHAFCFTTECIVELSNLGVPAHKIFVLFNLVEPGQDVETVFEPIFNFVDKFHLCMTDPEAVIYKNEVFALLRGRGQSLADVVNDQTDLKAAIKASQDPDEKVALAEKLSIRRLAIGVNKNLDEVFNNMMRVCQAG